MTPTIYILRKQTLEALLSSLAETLITHTGPYSPEKFQFAKRAVQKILKGSLDRTYRDLRGPWRLIATLQSGIPVLFHKVSVCLIILKETRGKVYIVF